MDSKTKDSTVLWVGTYPSNDTEPEGIWRLEIDPGTGVINFCEQVAEVLSPSFVAINSQHSMLYAISELPHGLVTAFTIESQQPWLRPVGEACSSGGEYPCHVVGDYDRLWISHYGDGTVSAHVLDAHGGLSGLMTQFPYEGSSRDLERQSGSHAHYVAVVDGHPLAVDLGTDQIRDHTRGEDVSVAALPPGTGPRHLATLPEGFLLVVGELDPAVFVLKPGPQGYEVVSRTALTDSPVVSGTDGRRYPSHIALSGDGRRAYVAVRGSDVMVVFDIHVTVDTVTLTKHTEFPSGGVWPRHFAVVPGSGGVDLVVIAHQWSHHVTVYSIAPDGTIAFVHEVTIPSPACVLPQLRR